MMAVTAGAERTREQTGFGIPAGLPLVTQQGGGGSSDDRLGFTIQTNERLANKANNVFFNWQLQDCALRFADLQSKEK